MQYLLMRYQFYILYNFAPANVLCAEIKNPSLLEYKDLYIAKYSQAFQGS
jgi:hypothetical protein